MAIFSRSIKDLFSNLGLVVPYLLNGVVLLFIGVILFFIFGLYDFVLDVINVGDDVLLLKDLFIANLGDIIFAVLFFVLLSLFITPFFDSMLYKFSVDIARGKRVKLRLMGKYGSNGYLRVLGMKFIGILIFFGFLIYASLSFLVLYGLWGKWIFFGLSLFFLLLVFSVLVFLVSMIFFYVYPAMFFMDKGVFDSIGASYNFFKNKKGFVVLSWLIVIGFSIGVSIVGSIFGIIPIVGSIIKMILNLLLRIWSNLYVFEVFKFKKL